MNYHCRCILFFPLRLACIFLCVGLVNSSDGIVYRTQKFSNAMQIPDIIKKTPDFIEAEGYIVETHQVTTEDGYILTVHRIPFAKNMNSSSSTAERPAVVIQHGVFAASDIWLLSGNRSFPFFLAENGYDVWLINSRGSSYSMKHVNMTSDDPNFWSYSFHEMGLYDLPASIDYVLKTTGQNKLFFVGTSRGTTSSYVMLSERPEYNEKIRLLIGYAPVAYLSHISTLAYRIAFMLSPRIMTNLLDSLHIYRFQLLTDHAAERRAVFCSLEPLNEICIYFIFLQFGFDYDLFNRTRTPVYLAHYPNNAGTQDLLHYLQLARSGRFQQYDWGADNYLTYRATIPPTYQLNKVTVPTALFLGPNDVICDETDVQQLISELPNVVKVYKVPFQEFTHIDFLWGTEAPELVYQPTIEIMSHY